MNDTPTGQDREDVLQCSDVRGLLFEYVTRELGEGRSDVVRSHLQRCEACREEAAEIQHTFELLSGLASGEANQSFRLTQNRRERIRWAFAHPVLDWIHVHHVLVSVVAALLVGALCGWAFTRLQLWHQENLEGYTVTIGTGTPTETTDTPPPDPPAHE